MKFNEPLGLPQGTVRALLAMMVIGAALVAVFIRVDPSDKTFIFSLAGVAFGYYFGARQSETNGVTKSEPLDQPPPASLGLADGSDIESRIIPGNEVDKTGE